MGRYKVFSQMLKAVVNMSVCTCSVINILEGFWWETVRCFGGIYSVCEE